MARSHGKVSAQDREAEVAYSALALAFWLSAAITAATAVGPRWFASVVLATLATVTGISWLGFRHQRRWQRRDDAS